MIGDVTHEDDEVMGDDIDAHHAIHTGHYHYGQTHLCDTYHPQHHYTLGLSQSRNNCHPTAHQFNSNLQLNPPPSQTPLIVIDGANISYSYAESLDPSSSSLQHNSNRSPNPHGIRLAIDYFLKHRCRVQAVVPTSWYRLRPRNKNEGDAKMVTDEVEELRILREQGFFVACPPGDDDDAYAIALARREDDRQNETKSQHEEDETMMSMDNECTDVIPASLLGGYILSNDFFHDAVRREEQARTEQHHFYSARGSSLRAWLNQNRISYSFANVGQTFQGQAELEFLPNPRHQLIECIEASHRFVRDL